MKQVPNKSATFIHPENILAKAGLHAGQTVVDFGCGGGYFVIAAAQIVGDDGHVYAVDILKDALSSVESRARMYGVSNITTVWSDAEQVGAARQIKDRSCDVVLLVQLLSQSKQHENIMQEVERVITATGSLVVVDWRDSNLQIGPSADERVSIAAVQELTERHHFTLHREIEAGPYHFGLVFERG